ncbi:HNH endonuclease [Aurantimicrobium minutum]|uniref:HNH endonuclease n=1 Tax=Aurantimicrobium minutum TaxID=708131 RepID=UPI003D7A59A0
MCDRPGTATKTGVQRHPYCARVSTLTPERKLSSSTELVHVPKSIPEYPASHARGSFWWACKCKGCGEKFTSKHGYAYCSDTCTNKYRGADKRKYSKRKRLFIIHRDNYKCQLCYTEVNTNLPSWNELAPEIDHIIPVHLGGDNTRNNLRLTHRVCNRSRNVTDDYDEESQWQSYRYAA